MSYYRTKSVRELLAVNTIVMNAYKGEGDWETFHDEIVDGIATGEELAQKVINAERRLAKLKQHYAWWKEDYTDEN